MSIKKEILSGTLFTAVSKYTYIFISLVVTAILARILTPEDFGTIAIATVLIAFINLFCDMGFGPAIIQNKDLTDEDVNNIFTYSMILACVLALALYFSSQYISRFYDQDSLMNVCKLLSINIFFTALNIVPKSLILKNKEFKFIAKRNVIVNILLGFISVIAAYLGMGIYSLLVNPIGSSIIMFFINFKRVKIKISISLSITSIKKIISFSTYQFLFNFINYFSRNLDQLLIGKFIGLTSLGLYEKSYRLMQQPIGNIANVLTPVMHPILSEFQSQREKLLDYTKKITSLLALVGFCITPFLFFMADELIMIVFGKDWVDSIPVFRILSLSVCFQMINSATGSILQSGNGSKLLFLSGLINSLLNVVGILIGVLYYGEIENVAVFIVVTFGLNLLVSYYFIYSVMFKCSVWNELIKLLKPLTYALVISIILYFVGELNLTFFKGLLVKGGVGIIFLLGIYKMSLKQLLRFKN
ncbi:lipopolysaccharide biosynthesis protein [Marinifilum flexuosum]|uniref:lipopolysaccharide biosynthesis protein n=1 Tax=Marinifilum flexuosum TaxID=1117708 RepID=UPI0024938676|nr:lipopolysaccharide biosynthesis protein [Marinifilum flexuosum]